MQQLDLCMKCGKGGAPWTGTEFLHHTCVGDWSVPIELALAQISQLSLDLHLGSFLSFNPRDGQ